MVSTAAQLQINPLSPENLADPIPLYREMRANTPVFWSDMLNAWFITRYNDVKNCFRDSRLTGDRRKLFALQLGALGPEVIESFMRSLSNQVGMKDGADHLRLRRQMNPGFTPQVIDSWCPAIRRAMNQLLDQVQAEGRMDVAQLISNYLPPRVIAEILGVPPQAHQQFQVWSEALSALASPPQGSDIGQLARQADEASRDFAAYLSELIDKRRHSPEHDVLSLMIHAEHVGKMSHEEMLANASLLLSAGYKTTSDLISNAVHELLTHPEQLRKLQEDRSLLKSTVDEVLRYRPPLPFFIRVASEPLKLHDKTIRVGDVVFLGIGAANRDPDAYPDPDVFDITRDSTQQKNLSFGFGAHHCIGSGLARRELEITLDVLLDRMPGLRLDEERPPKVKCDSLLFRGFNSLPVRW